jgi:hypothetical protein
VVNGEVNIMKNNYYMNKISDFLGHTSVLLVLSCFIVLFVEGYLWLRYGDWTSHHMIGFTPDTIQEWLFFQGNWVGLKKIILWSLECPLSIFLLILGLLILGLKVFIETNISSNEE